MRVFIPVPVTSSGQCYFYNALPHYLGAVGSGTYAIHCLTPWRQWAVELLQYTASLPWSNGQCNTCGTLPRRLGVVGGETFALQCLTAWGQRVVALVQCTSSLPRGSR